jgi:anaerobic ribonucleoside-triphosphate reductase activating protein
LGGEPFEPENQRALLPFLKEVRKQFPEKNIWCYTGYTLESDLLRNSRARCECTDEMLGLIDVLVDGEFKEELKDISLQFRGSSNQRIINVSGTLKSKTMQFFASDYGHMPINVI